MTLPRIECPVCGRNVPLTSLGKKARIREHKPDSQSSRVCRATGFAPDNKRLAEIAAEVRAGKVIDDRERVEELREARREGRGEFELALVADEDELARDLGGWLL